MFIFRLYSRISFDLWWRYVDGLVQDSSISIANAMEILKSCTKPSMYALHCQVSVWPWTRSPLIIWASSHMMWAPLLRSMRLMCSHFQQLMVLSPTLVWLHDSQYPRYIYDDVMEWKHFPCYWPFVRGIHRSPVNSPLKDQWRGALMFSLICVWIKGWVNNREAGDLRRYRAHYDVFLMSPLFRECFTILG